jgi:hypothetical protein
MAVKLDLSKVPSSLRSAIMNKIELSEKIKPDLGQPDIIILQDENMSEGIIESITRRIKDLLIQLKIRDYVAVRDTVDNHKILIIGRTEAEDQGSFHCHHCGMEFIDEIQLGIHQRLHLPF